METTAPARRRGRLAILLAAVIGAALVWAAVGFVNRWSPAGQEWTRVTTLEQLANEGVIYLQAENVFVSFNPSDPTHPVALSGISPHRPHLGVTEQMLFCRSAGYFEGVRWGSRFDRLGNYALGPAPRGMDHVGVMVKNGAVYIAPVRVTEGNPRFAPDPLEREGSFCGGPAAEPGFATKAPPQPEHEG